MEKKRQANIELLRIALMCTIPVYHLMLYNGVFYVDYHSNTILSLILSVGGAIPADYAFMAISAYYLQEAGTRINLRRFLRFWALLVTLYLLKTMILRGLFGFHNTKYFVDLFLMRGAWWYADTYLLFLLIYPCLNRFLAWAEKRNLFAVTAAAGILFIGAGIWNRENMAADMLAFVIVYLVMGILRQENFRYYWGIKTTPRNMAAMAAVFYLLMLGLCVMARIPGSIFPPVMGVKIVRWVTGRYSPLAAVMGLAVFMGCRGVTVHSKRWIPALAGCTTYVFLLHDAIMGVFWYFGKCWINLSVYGTAEFLGWTMIYLVTCFAVCYPIGKVYARWVGPWWDRGIEWICNCKKKGKKE